jgi:hypothetical protein
MRQPLAERVAHDERRLAQWLGQTRVGRQQPLQVERVASGRQGDQRRRACGHLRRACFERAHGDQRLAQRVRPALGEHRADFQPRERARTDIHRESVHLRQRQAVSLQQPLRRVQQAARQVQPVRQARRACQRAVLHQRDATHRARRLNRQ